MRKLYLIALLAAATTVTGAAQSKFNASGRAIMNRYEIMKTQPKGIIPMSEFSAIDDATLSRAGSRVSVYVTLNDGYDVSELEARGFDIVMTAGNIAIASGTMDDIAALEACDFVKAIEFSQKLELKLDKTRDVTGVTEIHEGTGLERAYTGDGVVVGLFDIGIDPNHANFLTATKKSRISKFWKFVGNNGNYTTYENNQISSYETDDKNESHGTHTLGCLAGSFNRSVSGGKVAVMGEAGGVTCSANTKNPYYGMAKEAEIVAAAGTIVEANVSKTVELIADYAKSQNKPCVVNLSIGWNKGPHDGTDAITRVLDELGKQVIICISAGNEGSDKISLGKTFTASDNQMNTFIRNDMESGFTGGYDVWSDNSTAFTITPVIYDLSAKKVVYEYPVAPGEQVVTIATDNYSYSGYINNEQFDKAFKNSFVQVSTSYNKGTNSRYCADVYVDITYNSSTNADKNLVLGFKVTGTASQHVQAVLQSQVYGMELSSYGQAGYLDGDSSFSINSIACGHNVICVGAWNARPKWPIIGGGSGSIYQYGANSGLTTEGDIANFSSYATLLDGRKLPFVVAPGVAVISSISTYYFDSQIKKIKEVSASQKYNNRQNYWQQMQGTSMSSPVAAGIIALWLEAVPTLTIDEVKDIIAKTAIRDEFVAAEPNRFGLNGKIDALAGLKYAIEHYSAVHDITADAESKLVLSSRGQNQWEVYVPAADAINASIYSTSGQLVKTVTADGSTLAIDANDLNKGIYILNINGHLSERIAVR